MMSLLPDTVGKADQQVDMLFAHVLEVKTSVLELRNQHQLSPKENIDLVFPSDPSLINLWNTAGAKFVLKKLANAECSEGEGTGVSFLAGKFQYHAALTVTVDKASEIKRMEEEIAYYEGFLKSVEKKLGNEKFVSNAHPDVVEKERQKQADGLSKIEQLRKSIEQLN
jgi:valyl-tRNA synthetase